MLLRRWVVDDEEFRLGVARPVARDELMHPGVPEKLEWIWMVREMRARRKGEGACGRRREAMLRRKMSLGWKESLMLLSWWDARVESVSGRKKKEGCSPPSPPRAACLTVLGSANARHKAGMAPPDRALSPLCLSSA